MRCYRQSDAESLNIIAQLLSARNAHSFRSAVEQLAWRPLTASRGIITYASLSRNALGGVDTTVYLAPQLFDRALA